MSNRQVVVIESIILGQNPMDKIEKHLRNGFSIKQLTTLCIDKTIVLTLLLEKEEK